MTSFLFFSLTLRFSTPCCIIALVHLPKVILYGKLMELPKVLELTNSASSLVLRVGGIQPWGRKKPSHKFFQLKDSSMCNT